MPRRPIARARPISNVRSRSLPVEINDGPLRGLPDDGGLLGNLICDPDSSRCRPPHCDQRPHLPHRRDAEALSLAEADDDRGRDGPLFQLFQAGSHRRELLMLAGATTGLVVLGGAASGCGRRTGTPPTGPVTAGNISALTIGSLLVMTNFVVARDAWRTTRCPPCARTRGACSMTAPTTSPPIELPLPRVDLRRQRKCHGGAGEIAAATLRGDDRRGRQHHRRRQPARLHEHPHVGRLGATPTLPAFARVEALPLSAP